ncbi:MAG: dockerin type I repeat-containing protein [Oscillospiraceae bacterium]|nr:dockerin type I repeat-containing protein [Oscillospiraceae bacterium]
MKKFRIYMITALMTMICCSFSVNAEETKDILDTVQTTETVDVTESVEELTEATESTEYTDTTEVITTEMTTVTTVSETSETTVTTVTEIDENRLFGDVNNDGKFNVRDAAYVARHIASGTIDELEMYFADYNSDGRIDVRDCAKIAKDITAKASQQAVEMKKGLPTLPDKADYNLTTDSGMKAYVNDMTRYKAFTKYGITAVAYDDTVDVWDYSWDVPTVYLSDSESYLAKHEGVLIIGTALYDLPQHYIDNGYSGLFSEAEDESEMADILVNDQLVRLDMMVDEFKVNGYTIDDTEITLSWQPTDGVGNYEVYLLWGGSKGNYFQDMESYKEYWNMTDEMCEIAEENFYKEYINLYEAYGDEYMVEYKNWYYTYEDIVLGVEMEKMSWSVFKEKVLQLGTYEDPNDYSWLDLTQEQLNRFNSYIAEMSLEEVNELMKGLRTACLNDTVDEYLDEIGA